jgi:2',3'-cyclic-nucleotide 2'-phosphodiesterase (5'-nucleotidase family)
MSDALTFIHTNDTHGRFAPLPREEWPPPARRLQALLHDHPHAVLLDAGDAVTAGNLGFRIAGEPALEVMSDLGYQAMCVGNRESHPRREIFPRKLAHARFPILCANLVGREEVPLPVQPHVVLERSGWRIGVFGVSVQMFTRKQWASALCDYWFDPPLDAARREVKLLRPQVDLLIALTHIGLREDLRLAEACPELDLVIGGHSHTELEQPERVGPVSVVQARAFAFSAGLGRFERTSGRPRLVTWTKVPLRDA